MTDQYDRTIHAQDGEMLLVRYDKVGKWYVEYEPSRMRAASHLTLTQAVKQAGDMKRHGGTVFIGRSGGMRFDAECRKAGIV